MQAARGYLGEPIKGLLGHFILFAVVLEVGHDAWPDALEFLESGRHADCSLAELIEGQLSKQAGRGGVQGAAVWMGECIEGGCFLFSAPPCSTLLCMVVIYRTCTRVGSQASTDASDSVETRLHPLTAIGPLCTPFSRHGRPLSGRRGAIEGAAARRRDECDGALFIPLSQMVRSFTLPRSGGDDAVGWVY